MKRFSPIILAGGLERLADLSIFSKETQQLLSESAKTLVEQEKELNSYRPHVPDELRWYNR